MNLLKEFEPKSLEVTGQELHELATELYPICRSITGNGVRQTLELIGKRIPLKKFEVATGTPVLDWTVPKEWNIRDAYIKDPTGKRVVDFQRCNLHVVSYSKPVHLTLPLAELKAHLFTLPESPDRIPYRTSYYKEDWGFCLTHNQMLALPDGDYDVRIDSSLGDGKLTYAECFLPGSSSEEVLISCHICHPSLANDNLSGLVVATFLAQTLVKQERHYSYRFLFIPGTIGAITWLAQNRAQAEKIRHGLVLTCIGDSGGFHYKKSRRGNAEIDRAAAHVLAHSGESSELLEFLPSGYDERQYCSPGFNLPVGCLMRSVWGTFSEYHTSADNLDFIKPRKLAESLRVCMAIVGVVENNGYYRNLSPYGEPQLGRRGLYGSAPGHGTESELNARLWVLNLSDGNCSLLDIAGRSKLPFEMISDAAKVLCKSGLLEKI